MVKEIGRGAEATILLNKDIIIKDRLPKGYRHPKLDSKLRQTRTRREVKILQKIGDVAPKVFGAEGTKIEMEYIDGDLVKNIIDKKPELAKEIGKLTGIMHDKHIMHGDLTTSNMILDKKKIRFIDFGLSIITYKVEDKAVDLHLFKEAVQSKHYKSMGTIWKEFVKGYNPSNKKEILQRLEIVERRGRNKEKY